MKAVWVEITLRICWFYVTFVLNAIVVLQINEQIHNVDRFAKLDLTNWEFDAKLHGFSVQLIDKVNERSLCSSPDSDAIVDKSYYKNVLHQSD